MSDKGDEGQGNAKGNPDPKGQTDNSASGDNKTPDPPKEGSGISSELKDEIRQIVREITGQANPKPADKGDNSGGDTRPNSYLRRMEDAAESAVKEAADRFFKEKAHAEEHEKMKTPPPEGQPKEKGRAPLLQRILWGEE